MKRIAQKVWKVGDLARQTGLSARTLHFYDEIGLLCPSERSEAGYRLYDENDVARLGAIKSLQHIGLSLQEIETALKKPNFSPRQVLELHLSQVNEQIERGQALRTRLERALAHLEARQSVSVAEFLKIIEAITLMEKYYTPEQLAYLEERKQQVGPERIQEVEAEWPRLMDEVRQAVERGDDPASESSQALAKRWKGLVEEFTGGNAGIRQSLNTVYETESNVGGMDMAAMRPLFDFIQRATQTARDDD